MVDVRKEVEAILFIKGEPVTVDELAKLLNIKNKDVITHTLQEIKKDYDTRDSSVTLVETHNGWKMNLKNDYIHVAKNISVETELSKSMMETLAVIAWKQPATQSDIIKVRTNKAYDEIKQLMEMGFIQKERFGRTYLIRVTQKFFDYFDIPHRENVKGLFKDVKGLEILQKDDEEEKKRYSDELGEDSVKIKTYGELSEGDEIKKAEMEIGEHLGRLPVCDMPDQKIQDDGLEIVEYSEKEQNPQEAESEQQISAPDQQNVQTASSSQQSTQSVQDEDDGLTDLFREAESEDLSKIRLNQQTESEETRGNEQGEQDQSYESDEMQDQDKEQQNEQEAEQSSDKPETATEGGEIDDNEGKLKIEEEPNEHGDLGMPVHKEKEDHGDIPPENP